MAEVFQLQYDSSSCWSTLRQSDVIMSVLERVVQFLYEIWQWWSGWWYTSGGQQETRLLQPHSTVLIQGALVIGQQEKVSCVEKVR